MTDHKFRPKRALRTLGKTLESERHFQKPIALAQLLAWASRDQNPKSKIHAKKRAYRTRNAKAVGLIVLLQLLAEAGSTRDVDLADSCNRSSFKLMLKLFEKMGGYAAAANTDSARVLIDEIRERVDELKYIVVICDYLVRYPAFYPEGSKHTIEDAKAFTILELERTSQKPIYKMSKVSQIWETHKDAAPMIYVLFGPNGFKFDSKLDLVAFVSLLRSACSNHEALLLMTGQMASVADLLAKKTRDPRSRDYKDIARVSVAAPPFSNEEHRLIAQIDRKGAIA